MNKNLNDNILINILTRTGKRKRLFNNLKRSIDNQTYKNIRHIISNDNPYCKFLKNLKNVLFIDKNKIKNIIRIFRGFYNLYLNKLAGYCKEGWVIILDDDAVLLRKNFLKNLSEVIKNTSKDNIIIYKTYLGRDHKIYPPKKYFDNKIVARTKIDMSCFCAHHSVFKNIKFHGHLLGDFDFLNKIKKNKRYKFKFVNLPIGIWANYEGPRLGK